jgi:acetyl-CoA carboxylase carboxyl transferase subunit alpha
MLENSIYSVISPEGCASIMWKDATRKHDAATALRYTAVDVKMLGCVDEVIREPEGGTHNDPALAMSIVNDRLVDHLEYLQGLPLDVMLAARYKKFRNIAQFYTTA